MGLFSLTFIDMHSARLGILVFCLGIFSSSVHADIITWTGASDNNWDIAANWTPAQVPTSTHDVIVPNVAPAPQLFSPVVISSLTIEAAGQLTLNRFDLTVSTDITIAGELTCSSTEQIRLGGNWSILAGSTFTYATSTVTFNGASTQTLSGSTTFYGVRAITNGATLQFQASTTQYATNMVEFRNVGLRSTTDNATWYFTYTGSSQTLNNLRVQDSNALGGFMMAASTSTDLGNNRKWNFGAQTLYWIASVPGNWSDPTNWSFSSAGSAAGIIPNSDDTVIFDVGSAQDSTVDASFAGTISTLTITSGYTGTLVQARSLTVSETFTVAGGSVSQGANPLTVTDLTQSSGTFVASSAFNAVILRDFNLSGGTFSTGVPIILYRHYTQSLSGSFIGGIAFLGATASNIDVNSTLEVESLNFSKNAGVNITIAAGDTLVTDNALTLGSGGTTSGGTFEVRGAVYLADGLGSHSVLSPLVLTGAGDQVIQVLLVVSSGILNGDITINKPNGQAYIASNPLVLNGANQDLTIEVGTFDLRGTNLKVDGTSGQLIVSTGGNLMLQGGETVTTNSGYPLFQTGSSATYAGGSGSKTLKTWAYYNLTLSTGGPALTYQSTAPLTIAGNLTISSGTFDVTAATNPLTIGGNWTKTNVSTFTHRNSTVTFNGTTMQTLSGNTTFYGLRAITSGATLQFAAGTTQYVTRMVEFRNVGLRSTTDNATWYFSYTGSSQTLTGLNVRDSNAIGGQMMSASNSTDLGNNRNWNFGTQTLYWVAPAPGNWSDPNNWSFSPGGSSASIIPDSDDTVIFDGGSVQDSTMDVLFGGIVSSMAITSAYTGNVTLATSFSANQFHLSGGSFTMSGAYSVNFSTYVQSGGAFIGSLTGDLTTDKSFSLSGGTFTAPGLYTVLKRFTISDGLFLHNTGIMDFISSNGIIDLTAPVTFYTVSINSNYTLTPTSRLITLDTLDLRGVVAGPITGGVIEQRGEATLFSSNQAIATSSMIFTGTGDQFISATASSFDKYDGDIIVDKPSGRLYQTLTGLTLNAAGQKLIIARGTYELGALNLAVNGTSGQLTVQNGGNLQLQGGETVTTNAGSPLFQAGSSATYAGGSGTKTLKGWPYANLILSTGASTVTYELPAISTVTGNLVISSGTLDVTTSNFAMSIGGDWTKSSDATFAARNSTITFNGADVQRLSGNTTFYGLRAVTSGATLQFTAGATQYATNMVEFRNVGLRSTTDNATWYFSYTGSSQALVGLRVQDSNASPNGGLLMDASGDSTTINLGNNTNWSFYSASVIGIVSTGSGEWYSTTPDAPWPSGIVPVFTDTVTIASGHVVVATASVVVSSLSIVSGGELDLDGTNQILSLTISPVGKLVNNGVLKILDSSNAVRIVGQASVLPFTFEGNDIDYNGKKVYLGALTYLPAMSLASGETVELYQDLSLANVTAASGSSFIMGNNNILTLTGNTSLASGTFTKGTGTSRIKLNGTGTLNTANQNLGLVSTGPPP